MQYNYWPETQITAIDQHVIKDFKKRDIFAHAKSYATFDESNKNDNKIMKKCFDKFLTPIWKKWKDKPSNNIDDEKLDKPDYYRFVIHIVKFKNPNKNEEINYAQICMASLTKTSLEAFRPYWECDPPQIKGCPLAEI